MTKKQKKEFSSDLSNLLILPRIFERMLGFNNIFNYFKASNIYEYEFLDKSNFIKEIISKVENSNNSVYKEIFIYDNLGQKLLEYDLNIKKHFDKINSKRKINLKYYQYLSLLYVEIYLDLYFKYKNNNELDILVEWLNNCKEDIFENISVNKNVIYEKEDLSKICFWMATGSGKTIIMHINFLQFLNYSEKYNNKINQSILITPNEDLTDQHIEDLDISNIKTQKLEKNNWYKDKNILKVFDINKLSLKQTDKGVSISINNFKENNVVLVDEGHRGSSGEQWLKYRKKISLNGFTFEYSATFSDVENKDVIDYRKTILFDYSFKHFNKDGYGKDYYICGVSNKNDINTQEIIFLGSLLAFYEQKKIYLREFKEFYTEFNIRDPLWIAVGSTVLSPKGKMDSKTTSDISKIVNFLAEFKFNSKKIISLLSDILNEKINIKDQVSNENFFNNKFKFIKEYILKDLNKSYELLYDDILKTVFNSKNINGYLELIDISSADGEIGLKYSDSNQYFGLIYVGKGNDKKLLENKDIVADIKQNKIKKFSSKTSKSLFEELKIELDQNNLNFLIGAKKFIAGWNNYRISSILLINFGKSKGASAIQLFGRGVRLYGVNKSLKRISEDPDLILTKNIFIKNYIHYLETLNVYGLNADYMAEFKNEIEKDVSFYKEFDIKPVINNDLIDKKLIYLRKEFDYDVDLPVVNLKFFDFDIDLNIKVKNISSVKNKNTITLDNYYYNQFFEKYDVLELLDWTFILSEIRRYKHNRNYNEIILPSFSQLKDNLRLENKLKFLFFKDFSINNEIYDLFKNNLSIIEFGIIEYLKKCITKTYSSEKRKLDKYHLDLLDSKDIIDNINVKFKFDEKNKNILSDNANISKLYDVLASKELFSKSLFEKYKDNLKKLIIDIDNHLFFPLFIKFENADEFSTEPIGLEESESSFVIDFKKYLLDNSYNLSKYDFILLRNIDRKGIGFLLEDNGNYFYPDFILWVVDNNLKEQKIVFVDPKGLAHLSKENKDKIMIEDYIKVKEKELKLKDPKYENYNYNFYSRIVTDTKKEDIDKDYWKYTIFKNSLNSPNNKYLDDFFESINLKI